MDIINKILNRMRTFIYSQKFDIGRGCSFGKIKFWDCDCGSIHIADNVSIFRGTELCAKKDRKIYIGANTFINQRCLLRPNVTIGKNVSIGPGVMLMSDSHTLGDAERRAGESTYKGIEIGDGCWIGAGVIILGGVSVANGVIIAAGSVLISNCEANTLWGGVPAKKIKQLE